MGPPPPVPGVCARSRRRRRCPPVCAESPAPFPAKRVGAQPAASPRQRHVERATLITAFFVLDELWVRPDATLRLVRPRLL